MEEKFGRCLGELVSRKVFPEQGEGAICPHVFLENPKGLVGQHLFSRNLSPAETDIVLNIVTSQKDGCRYQKGQRSQ